MQFVQCDLCGFTNPKTQEKIMPEIHKIFNEYGLDFDNNKYGIGHSTEIEYTDGTEKRTHERIKIAHIHARYFRFWIGKIVFISDNYAVRVEGNRYFLIVNIISKLDFFERQHCVAQHFHRF